MLDILLATALDKSEYSALQKLFEKLLLLYFINLEYPVYSYSTVDRVAIIEVKSFFYLFFPVLYSLFPTSVKSLLKTQKCQLILEISTQSGHPF